jgi:hypothetical protein
MGQRQQAKTPESPEGLPNDVAIQLGLSADAPHEQDGNLVDSQAQLPHAKGDFNLERVAIGGDAVKIEPLRERTPERSIAAFQGEAESGGIPQNCRRVAGNYRGFPYGKTSAEPDSRSSERPIYGSPPSDTIASMIYPFFFEGDIQ